MGTPKQIRDVRTISYREGMFLIRFDGSSFREILDSVRAVSRRSWWPDLKCWQVPAEIAQEVQDLAQKWDFTLTPDAISAIVAELNQTQTGLESYFQNDADIEVPGLKKVLKAFQRVGVAYGIEHKRFILADEMGLGKTVQAIGTIMHQQAFPCLVVCPSGLKINWKFEWKEWTGLSALLPDAYSPYLADYYKILIVNYESLHKFEPIFGKFKSIIADEAHALKNPKAKRTQLVKAAAKGKDFVLLLTGTPVLNRPAELISLLAIIGQLKHFGGFQTFWKQYCHPHARGSLRTLGDKLRATCMIRREKKDVLKELPDKIRQRIDIEITNRREYVETEIEFRRLISEANAANPKAAMALALTEIQKLRQVTAKGKIGALKELCESIWDSGEKVVVFCYHKAICQMICEALGTDLRISGDEDMEQRNRAVQAFQGKADEKTIVCTLKTAAVGLTLTAASKVIFVESEWTPALNNQAEDRCHRIGQEDTVTAYYLIARNTVDEHLWGIVEKKRRMIEQINTGTYEGNSMEDRKGTASELINLILGK